MSNNDKVTSQALQKSREGTPEEMRLQATTENWQRWCGRDMAWEIVPGTSGVDRKARSPTVDSRVRRTDSDDVDAERRGVLVSESADWRSSSAR